MHPQTDKNGIPSAHNTNKKIPKLNIENGTPQQLSGNEGPKLNAKNGAAQQLNSNEAPNSNAKTRAPQPQHLNSNEAPKLNAKNGAPQQLSSNEALKNAKKGAPRHFNSDEAPKLADNSTTTKFDANGMPQDSDYTTTPKTGTGNTRVNQNKPSTLDERVLNSGGLQSKLSPDQTHSSRKPGNNENQPDVEKELGPFQRNNTVNDLPRRNSSSNFTDPTYSASAFPESFHSPIELKGGQNTSKAKKDSNSERDKNAEPFRSSSEPITNGQFHENARPGLNRKGSNSHANPRENSDKVLKHESEKNGNLSCTNNS